MESKFRVYTDKRCVLDKKCALSIASELSSDFSIFVGITNEFCFFDVFSNLSNYDAAVDAFTSKLVVALPDFWSYAENRIEEIK
ncbi:TPA: hypothetical protein I7730_01275 [Vibrio vulnificus]|uniref:Uncharacterized protein n=1 Tax=Vibrio vulnificus TaxID=672 RepID=A0A8H9K6M1_VIBVL|nr:hypothetical protein [Vibrio vulnificus]